MENNDKEKAFDHQEENTPLDNMTNEQTLDMSEANEDANLADDLENKFNELNDSFLRLHAEYDNYRKRTMKEKADLIKTGGEKVVLGVLPIVDDFERALENIPDDAKEGVELIYNKFKTFLAQNGVKEIDSVGQPFDMDVHEAITTVPAQDPCQKDTIIECIQKGYTMNDKVIRYPKVIVAK
jgi:molecular chaperone GrpE